MIDLLIFVEYFFFIITAIHFITMILYF